MGSSCRKRIKQKKLMELTGIGTSSIAKLTKGENVTTDILCRICKALDCDFKDIMEYIDEKKLECKNSNFFCFA